MASQPPWLAQRHDSNDMSVSDQVSLPSESKAKCRPGLSTGRMAWNFRPLVNGAAGRSDPRVQF